MAWGISFDAYIRSVHKADIPSAIDECKMMIRFYENRLLTMCATNAMYFPDSGGGENVLWCEHVALEVPSIINELCEQAARLELLEQALMADKIEED